MRYAAAVPGPSRTRGASTGRADEVIEQGPCRLVARRSILHRHAPSVANGVWRKSTGRRLLQMAFVTQSGSPLAPRPFLLTT
jgi:hypothetical protein